MYLFSTSVKPTQRATGFAPISTTTPGGRRNHKTPSSGGYQSPSQSWWIALFAWLVLGSLSGMAQSPAPVTFSYNGTNGSDGSAQTYTVPSDVYSLSVVAFGAKGRDGFSALGGLGGKVEALLTVTPGQILTITVGGTSQTPSGGYNGGGSGIGSTAFGSGAGGGATDIRLNGNDLTNRVIVAGGGGGGSITRAEDPRSGVGGGLTGGAALGPAPGGGGTQSAGGAGGLGTVTNGQPGSLAIGGNGVRGSGGSTGGGGGGYYGGGSGGENANNYGTGITGSGGGG